MSKDSEDPADEKLKEKAKIVRATAATLYKFEAITRQLENWRDDRAKLQSNIWRLKLALSVVGKLDKPQRPLPLIECRTGTSKKGKRQPTQISEIERDGPSQNSWKIEEGGLRAEQFQQDLDVCPLGESTEAKRIRASDSTLRFLRRKLQEFVEGDHTVEMIICKVVSKFANTVTNLSEELVSANQQAQRYKAISEQLKVEVDRLNSQLKCESCDRTMYQKKASELENLAKKLEDQCALKTDIEKVESELSNARNEVRINEEIIRDICQERESYKTRQIANVKQAKEGINVLRSILQDLESQRKMLMKEAEDMSESMVTINQRVQGMMRKKRTIVEEADKVQLEMKNSRCELTNQLTIELKKTEGSLSEANVTIGDLKMKLDRVVSERNRMEKQITDLIYKNEILSQRLNIEETTNGEMMREYERITSETNVLQNDMETLANENIVLKQRLKETEEKLLSASRDQEELELLKKEISNCEISSADLKVIIGKTKAELEAANIELSDLKAENCRLEGSLNTLALENVNIEARLQALVVEKKELICLNAKLNEENDVLKDRLNEKVVANTNRFHEMSKADASNENISELDNDETASTMEREAEISVINDQQLCLENDALKKATTTLRNGIKTAFMENEGTKNKLRAAEKEIQALKTELFKLREEKQTLCSNLASVKMELNDLKLERSAMKDELIALRETKSTHRLEASTLQENCKKLKILNIDLENRLLRALRELDKYTINIDNTQC